MLRSERIEIRAIEENELETIAAWRNDPAVYEFFYEYAPISLRQQKNWFDKQISNPNEMNFIVASRSEKKPIGTVSIYNIDRRNRKAEWGRLLIGDKNFLSGGYGSEIEALILEYCFEHLNLNKLYCDILKSNEKVISLHEKFGFVIDGVLREHAFKSGEYVSVVHMSILRDEYIIQKESGYLSEMRKRMSEAQ